nr:MAG TPA: hypothetical protein [Caudoviricetes sp.]
MAKFFAEIAPFSYLWGRILIGIHCKVKDKISTQQ